MSGRVLHWERHLAELVIVAASRPFAWGSFDCACFAAEAIAAVTGEDPAAPWRGTYASPAEAKAIVAAHGGLEGVVAAMAEAWGWPDVSPRFAQRGDVVLADLPGGPTLGIVIGPAVVFPQHPRGLATVPITARLLRRAWAIGRAA